MDLDDPLVTAALYYSHEMRGASKEVSTELKQAAADLRAASQLAMTANNALTADRAKLMKDIQTHMTRCVKIASAGQSSNQGIRYVPAWYALVGAVLGAFALAAAWAVGVEHGATRAEEAAVGRSFARVVPTLDPKLKAQLMEHLRKNPG